MTLATADTERARRDAGPLDYPAAVKPGRRRLPRAVAYLFLVTFSVGMIVPLLWAAYTSLRPISDTLQHGYFSVARDLTFENYVKAWTQADFAPYFANTMIVLVPSLVAILVLSSFLGFALTRHSLRVNLGLLVLFTAGNLLPHQVIIIPLYHLYLMMPFDMADTYYGVILIHIAFQLGFCTFVMSSYMKTIPEELTDAALVDGASVWRQYWQIILPLCRAPMAALATLQFTWIYNDFFWALVLQVSAPEKQPITTALNSLSGVYFTDPNLQAAGALIVAIPNIVVFVLLQKHFVGGLTLGASKG
jgi:multiple sugar transport system permease protein